LTQVVKTCKICKLPNTGSYQPAKEWLVTKPHILIVDDDEQITKVLSKQFQKICFETFVASSVEEAIQMFRQTTEIRFVLSDFNIGFRNGYEIWHDIQDEIKPRQGSFVFMTGNPHTNVIQSLKNRGFFIITKPNIMDDFMFFYRRFIQKIDLQSSSMLLCDSRPN